MLKSDKWIVQAATAGMITPFENKLIRRLDGDRKVISYGVGSFGYDLRLSAKDFRIFHRRPGHILDPKRFEPGDLSNADLHTDKETGEQYFILPGNSYGLGVAVEHLDIPKNISVLCIGKSTYARCGIIANLTPAEAGWRGHLTLEFSNASQADCRIYANEGCVQLLFLEGEECLTSYGDRDGKYQDQKEQVTLPKA